MLKIILTVIMILALAGPGWGATYFARAFTAGGYGDNNGSSYDNAFGGIGPVDTITFSDDGSGNLKGSMSSTLGMMVTNTPIYVWSAGGTLPSNLTAGTVYYTIRINNYDFKLSTTEGPGAAIAYKDPGLGALKAGVGINWDATTGVKSGDTLYICGSIGNSEGTGIIGQWVRMVVYNAGVTIRGDNSTHPCTGWYNSNRRFQSGWTDTETNGVYYSGTTGDFHSLYYCLNDTGTPTLLNLRMRACSAVPTPAELGSFQAGDCAQVGTVAYIKPPFGANANPNNDTYLVIYSTSIPMTITSMNGTKLYGLDFYGGHIKITTSNSCEVVECIISNARSGVETSGTCDGIVITDNTIEYTGGGIYMSCSGGDSDGAQILRNTVNYTDNIGAATAAIDCHAIAVQQGINFMINDNIINTAATGPSVYTGGAASSTGEIKNNFIKNIYRWYHGGCKKVIEGMTDANPCVVTWTAHGLAVNDYVKFSGITQANWSALNGTWYQITAKSANTLTLGSVDSSTFGPYLPNVDDGFIRPKGANIDNSPGSRHGAGADCFGNGTGTINITIANNIVSGSEGSGIRALCYSASGTIDIYNNNLNNCNIGAAFGGVTSVDSTFNVKNNIFSAPVDKDVGLPVCYTWFYSNDNNPNVAVDYNDYVGLSGDEFFYTESGGGYATALVSYAVWKTGLGSDTHSITANPLFLNATGLYTDATDFKLKPKSPCGRKGVRIPGITTDFGGYRINNKPIGAWSLPATPGPPGPF